MLLAAPLIDREARILPLTTSAAAACCFPPPQVQHATAMTGVAVGAALSGLCTAFDNALITHMGLPAGVGAAVMLPRVIAFNATDTPTKQARRIGARGENHGRAQREHVCPASSQPSVAACCWGARGAPPLLLMRSIPLLRLRSARSRTSPTSSTRTPRPNLPSSLTTSTLRCAASRAARWLRGLQASRGAR